MPAGRCRLLTAAAFPSDVPVNENGDRFEGPLAHTVRRVSTIDVYIVDRVEIAAGRAREFVDEYQSTYMPGARDRGMRLDRMTLSPPLFLADDSNVLTVTWVVDGAGGWWSSALAARHDDAPARWWDSVADLVVHRTRTMEASVCDVAELCDV
ncbi:hypothetical protein JVX90_20335 [Gordonia sp. PDNC005]|nr:hypothetical protein JVX90_20335 [Gordonia sp. PDNC005]